MEEKILCICKQNNEIKWGEISNNIKCEKCNYSQHIDCIYPSNKKSPYICPLCQLSLFDPYLKIKYHFNVPQIIEKNIFKQNLYLKFFLDDKIFNMNIIDDNDILLLRCLKLTEEGFCLEWPDQISIYINNINKEIYCVDKTNDAFKRQINEEIPFKFNKNLKGKNPFNERMRYAFDYFKLNEENTIKIKFNSVGLKDKYIISLDYINIRENTDEIIKYIKIINDKNQLKEIINLNEFLLEDILFIDPISKCDLIKNPSRGWKCNHLECVDLKIFLEMQKKTRRFCCPICNKKIGEIYIDGVMKDIIEKNYDKYDGIQMNGNYDIIKFIEKNKENNIVKSNKNYINKNSFIDLNDNNEENYSDDDSYEFNINLNNKYKIKSLNGSPLNF